MKDGDESPWVRSNRSFQQLMAGGDGAGERETNTAARACNFCVIPALVREGYVGYESSIAVTPRLRNL
jgi:hypothetical protein